MGVDGDVTTDVDEVDQDLDEGLISIIKQLPDISQDYYIEAEQDPNETLIYYLPKDELRTISNHKEGEQAQLPDLQYPINPIFRRERWLDLADRQWTLVQPVLHLASAFLESEASFIVLYSIINAPHIRVPRPRLARSDEYEIRKFDPSNGYQGARLELKENLALFGDNLWWRVTDLNYLPDHVGRDLTDCYGKTQRQESQVIQFSNHIRKNITGHGSLISMNERFWHMLELLETYKGTPNEILMTDLVSMTLNLYLPMAVAFCHELAHMVHIASHSTYAKSECFWENDAVAEYGRVWEQEVFGGTVKQQTPFLLDQPPFVVKWPDIFTMEWANNDAEKTREMTKGSSTYYVVPLRWMAEVTSQRFWDQYSSNKSPTLLWIPKRLGLRVTVTENELPWWRLSQSSEGCDSADESRIVRRRWISEIPSLNDPVHDLPGPPASRTRSKSTNKRKCDSDFDESQYESNRPGKRRRGAGR
ncbi:hypothetical protein MMC11_008100 [Xylographa trunciseda]|nr:hypothetical protein [Xylographa trunciseda]